MSSSSQRVKRRVLREEARAQIHYAAVRALRSQRFRDLSIDALMAETELARTAFYRYYDDLGSLVVEILGEVGADLYRIVEAWAVEGEQDFPAASRRGITRIVDFFATQGPLVQAVADAAASDELVDKAYSAFLATYDRLIVRGFDGMVARGELDPCDTKALARALNLMGERVMLDAFGQPPFADPATVVATMELIWLRVIGPKAVSRGA